MNNLYPPAGLTAIFRYKRLKCLSPTTGFNWVASLPEGLSRKVNEVLAKLDRMLAELENPA